MILKDGDFHVIDSNEIKYYGVSRFRRNDETKLVRVTFRLGYLDGDDVFHFADILDRSESIVTVDIFDDTEDAEKNFYSQLLAKSTTGADFRIADLEEIALLTGQINGTIVADE